MNYYDSRADTLKHIGHVKIFINWIIDELIKRADNHDQSKLGAPEKECFDEFTPKLSSVTYGSDEYRNMLKKMGPAISHHHENNRHHPEFFKDGIGGMDIIDVIEMLCDWKAATMRHQDGNLHRSIDLNVARHDLNEQLAQIFKNTANNLGW